MTTIQQQIDFVVDLRESFDNGQRQTIIAKYGADKFQKLLRDVNDTLYAMKLLQLNPKQGEFCSDCNKLLTPHNRVNYAVADSHVIVSRSEHVCDQCTNIRIERLNAQPNV